MHSLCIPNVLSGIFAENIGTRKWAMTMIKDLDNGLRIAHELLKARPNSALGQGISSMIHDCWWARLPIGLETIQVARDAEFDYLDEEVVALGVSLFGGPSNSKFTCEDVFAHLQHIISRTSKGYNKMNKPLDVKFRIYSHIDTVLFFVFLLSIPQCLGVMWDRH